MPATSNKDRRAAIMIKSVGAALLSLGVVLLTLMLGSGRGAGSSKTCSIVTWV